jgi:hypothetical protein
LRGNIDGPEHDPAGYNTGNSRSCVTRKIARDDFGEIELEKPRERNAAFSPPDAATSP